MEQKKLYQMIVERLAADPDLRERVLNAGEDELMVMLKEHGITDVPKEEAVKLQNALRGAFDQDGALDDDALENVAGGFFAGVWGPMKQSPKQGSKGC